MSGAEAVVRRVLPAPPGVVFDEWLDAEGMREWMCPRPAVPTRIEIDPRVGGRYAIDIDDEGFALTVSGRYLELDRPRLLRFTWHCTTWDPGSPDSEVTVALEPHEGGRTLMTIRHELLPAGLIDSHETGWGRIAGQLEQVLTRR